jgi:hypothetical protein
MAKTVNPDSEQPAPRGNGQHSPAGTSIFDDLESLRLEDVASLTSSVEVLAHVPVRRPTKTEFFRVHSDMSLAASIFEDREEREIYFVPPAFRSLMLGYLKPVLLAVCLSRQGVLFLWPVALPSDDGGRGGSRAWSETARQAAEMAKSSWVQIRADMSLGSYRVRKAEGVLPDPVWPAHNLGELLAIAFRNRIIDDPEHPVLRRLRGVV